VKKSVRVMPNRRCQGIMDGLALGKGFALILLLFQPQPSQKLIDSFIF